MASSKSSKSAKSKAKASPKAKAAKPAHKKVAARKVVARKNVAKHTAKPTRTAAARSDSDYTKFSGKFTVRLPKSLHQALVDRAEREGVSLNLFVTNALSRTVAVAGKGKR
ncbi:MAG: toxin-antitoxin system HicB family antitoxin [Candidatus Melainabacteria bacterium]|mgnify:CR=1 FL=1|jgi:hypothetical protein|nr:toxin-antitoxin system HicB family antitoxin [Candidatus Melainabacteria bacterium]